MQNLQKHRERPTHNPFSKLFNNTNFLNLKAPNPRIPTSTPQSSAFTLVSFLFYSSLICSVHPTQTFYFHPSNGSVQTCRCSERRGRERSWGSNSLKAWFCCLSSYGILGLGCVCVCVCARVGVSVSARVYNIYIYIYIRKINIHIYCFLGEDCFRSTSRVRDFHGFLFMDSNHTHTHTEKIYAHTHTHTHT